MIAVLAAGLNENIFSERGTDREKKKRSQRDRVNIVWERKIQTKTEIIHGWNDDLSSDFTDSLSKKKLCDLQVNVQRYSTLWETALWQTVC